MIRFKVDDTQKFAQSLRIAQKEVDDLTVPLMEIARSWFKGNKSIFAEKAGPGKYRDLKPSTKKQKLSKFGFIYPVLRASGKLERSITDPNGSGAVSFILNKHVLHVGTSVSSKKGTIYPSFLQSGTRRMRARPPLLLGVEQVAPSSFNKRIKNWEKLLADYVLQKTGRVI